MNVSGPALATAWRAFLKDLAGLEEKAKARLVVLHDELEAPLGQIKVKYGGSVKGHNGLKSCVSNLRGLEFVRVGVGIGRPASRESGDVAAYVLRKMKPEEMRKIEGGVEEVLEVLDKLGDESY